MSSLRTLSTALVLALLALPAGSAFAAPSEDDPPPPPPPAPQFTVTPGAHDFGIVELDRGGQNYGFNVQNVGVDWAPIDVQIVGEDASAFWFDWNNCGGSLSPWATCGVGVHFNPSEPREYHATLRARSGDYDFTAELSGTGGLRQVTATPSPVEFGETAVGESATRTVAVKNTGNVFFQSMVAIPIGGDVGAFRLLADGCSMTPLAPSASCQLRIRFTPDDADNYDATLAMIGEGNPTLITLRGAGVAPKAPTSAVPAETKRKKAKKAASVSFNWRRGLPAPFQGNRVDLGVARCNGAPTCRVTVRASFVASDGHGGFRTTPMRRAIWWLGSGSSVSLWLPKTLAGKPVRLVVDLKTRAAGRPAGLQRLSAKLIQGIRRNGAVVATPAGR